MSAIKIVLILVFVVPLVILTLAGGAMAISLQDASNRRNGR